MPHVGIGNGVMRGGSRNDCRHLVARPWVSRLPD
jgi:hypothetical protein